MTRVTCHCGAVELAVTLAQPVEEAKRCDCSLCRRRAAGMLTVKAADLTVTKGADALSVYSFNTHTAQHYFCKVCGIYTHHRRRADPGEYGVNLGCIEGVNPRDFDPLGWYDGVNHPSDQAP